MTAVAALECRRCGRRFGPGDVEYTCPDHDGVTGVLDVVYDDDALAESANWDRFVGGLSDPDGVTEIADLWAFESLLPVEPGDRVCLGAGGTPLLDAPRLGERLDADVWVKDETGNPTGSSKDRGTAVVATRAHQRGHDVLTCASTGNAAASLAGYAARAGLECRIFVPADLPDAKAVQPRLYGADVLAIDGTYAEAYDLCRDVAAARGWHNASAALNPYAVEGHRTLGFELALQSADADWVVLPMGNGCSLAGVWKGLAEFERLGVLDSTPRLLGVQAAGATAIRDRFVAVTDGKTETVPASTETGTEAADGAAGTVADSIDVGAPHNAERACDALVDSGGTAVVVSDEHLLRAQRLLGATEGVFVEPASAAAVAGVDSAREQGSIAADDRVVVVATGTGLKDPAAARSGLDPVRVVDADVDAVLETL